MLRYADVVRGVEFVREVEQKYPETTPVFRKFHLRATCYDCPIEHAARQAGAPLDDLLVEVNVAIHKVRGVTA
jgi:hypothetical protein